MEATNSVSSSPGGPEMELSPRISRWVPLSFPEF